MDGLFENIVCASLYSSLLAIIYIMARKVLTKQMGAIWFYYLWFTIFLPWAALFIPDDSLIKHHLKVNDSILSTQLAPNLSAMTMSTYFPNNFLTFAWLFGATCSVSYLIYRHLTFNALLKDSARSLSVDEKISILKLVNDNELMHFRHTYLSPIIQSPMINHLFNPKMYLPHDFFTQYSYCEQKHILKHEYTHYKNRDLIANFCMLLLASINWFNPVLYFSYRYFRNAQELACDARITQTLTQQEKKAYGYSLLKTAINQSMQPSTITCWWNSGNQLKERCQMLKLHARTTQKTICGLGLFLIAACTAFAAPTLNKISNANTPQGVTFSAYSIHKDKAGRENYLIGNVEVIFKNNVKLNADRMLIKYNPVYPSKITECVIYGRGLLTVGGHITEFKDGSFYPKKMKLTANDMNQLQ